MPFDSKSKYPFACCITLLLFITRRPSRFYAVYFTRIQGVWQDRFARCTGLAHEIQIRYRRSRISARQGEYARTFMQGVKPGAVRRAKRKVARFPLSRKVLSKSNEKENRPGRSILLQITLGNACIRVTRQRRIPDRHGRRGGARAFTRALCPAVIRRSIASGTACLWRNCRAWWTGPCGWRGLRN